MTLGAAVCVSGQYAHVTKGDYSWKHGQTVSAVPYVIAFVDFHKNAATVCETTALARPNRHPSTSTSIYDAVLVYLRLLRCFVMNKHTGDGVACTALPTP
jgi:hypothetical protein